MFSTEVLRTIKVGQVATLAPLLPKVSSEPVKAKVITAMGHDDGSMIVVFAKSYFGTYMGDMEVTVDKQGRQQWKQK
ncbi:hypothetical protein EVB27_138 [Rhizobium phage RHph_TM16]|nr:hypothetical protein EVB27_138 [Rhizobium phage RHph_TM16]